MSIMTTISRHGITLPINPIAELCEKYGVRELSVFGSLLRDDFRPESDIDFLVVFGDDDLGPWMEKLLNMEEELRVMLGREVDLVPKESIVKSENWIRRNHILSTAQVIYGS
jgi:predicted nucleotidyltransferase